MRETPQRDSGDLQRPHRNHLSALTRCGLKLHRELRRPKDLVREAAKSIFARSYRKAVAQEAKMNPIDITPWIGDWVWSLPSIVWTVVIHVGGLALIGGKFVDVLGDSLSRRRFMRKFAVVIGGGAVLASVLHGIEGGIWAATYRLLGLYRTTGPRCSTRSAR